jgi:hypothetical protein
MRTWRASVDFLTWQHLQVVRNNGVSTFYIDGVAQSHQTTAAPDTWAGPHLAVNPGGAPVFFGNIDELTISSVPEPSTIVLVAAALIGLLAYAWRKR